MTDAEVIAEHIKTCTDAQGVVVMDHGSADPVIRQMLDAGWKLSEQVDYVGGKRIRFMEAPPANMKCARCGRRITYWKGYWWGADHPDTEDWMCPDGQEDHTPDLTMRIHETD